ncbi:DNA-binding protein [Roseovarius sp. TE539]|uniref:helix-turn-helix transcriptional regulator n=1 Tax=Roseovarius sp. TE539 TaxID=2249812 RepID=UPI000DDF5D04|nr:DNA-binding protein [Roseovarius sp. TE539]
MTANTQLLTPLEAASYLRVSKRTLDRWHAMRIGPPRVSAGRRVFYQLEALHKWLEDNEVHPIAQA